MQLSFAELSEKSGLSVSYLNEIEKGKKYPKEDKIKSLAAVLNTDVEELTSLELGQNLAPINQLLRSNFLNELPLDLFGIELSKVIEIIANAPARVGAFISTLLEISRNYALNEESFFFGALRSYLQLHNNYFDDLETAVSRFTQQFEIHHYRPVSLDQLKSILQESYRYEIIEAGLDAYLEFKDLRSLFLPTERHLLLSGRLTPLEQRFQFAKELGFNFLGLKERAYTSSILKSQSFEEVLNHARSNYFAVALHIPLQAVTSDLRQFFQRHQWDGQAFLAIMRKYSVSPDMFYQRLTNILPRFFGIEKLFLLRLTHDLVTGALEIDRELHLNQRHQPHRNGLNEHYCRRWVAVSLLQKLRELRQKNSEGKSTLVRVQRSLYVGSREEYLCITIAQPVDHRPDRNVSVTLGLLIDEDLDRKISFLNDPTIQMKEVNITCERCGIEVCTERAAEPAVIRKKRRLKAIQRKLDELLE